MMQLGQEEQSQILWSTMALLPFHPLEDEATEKACGVMYIAVNKEIMVPTTLKAIHVRSFEKAIEIEYEISLDSVLKYNDDATLKFAIEKEEAPLNMNNKEMM